MSRILALDTATEACSVAVLDGSRLISRYQLAPRAHAKLLLGLIDEVLGEAGLTLKDMDALAFGRGPGSFTGVRIATGVVQGLAFGAGKPVVAVSTLRAIAQGAARQTAASTVIAAIDARMGEVYVGAFARNEQGLMQPLWPEQVCKPAALQGRALACALGSGSGWLEYPEQLLASLPGTTLETEPRFPAAEDIVRLAAADLADGLAVPSHEAQPVYLRDEVAEKPKPKA